MIGRLADGWLPSLGRVGIEDLAAMQEIIDGAARNAGRDPAEIRRMLNLSGSIDEAAPPRGRMTDRDRAEVDRYRADTDLRCWCSRPLHRNEHRAAIRFEPQLSRERLGERARRGRRREPDPDADRVTGRERHAPVGGRRVRDRERADRIVEALQAVLATTSPEGRPLVQQL